MQDLHLPWNTSRADGDGWWLKLSLCLLANRPVGQAACSAREGTAAVLRTLLCAFSQLVPAAMQRPESGSMVGKFGDHAPAEDYGTEGLWS